MDNTKSSIQRGDPLEMTSRFTSNTGISKIDVNKLNILKSKMQQLVKHATKKYINDSMGDVLYNKNEDNLQSLKARRILANLNINSSPLKRSNSFVGNFMEEINQIKTNNVRKKPSSNNINSPLKSFKSAKKSNSSSNIFELFNTEFQKQKLNNYQKINVANIDSSNILGSKISSTTNSSFLINEKLFFEKKQNKLVNLKKRILDEEQQTIKMTPGIDIGSLKIINEKLKDKKPIYDRFDEIKIQKQAKIEQYKKELIRNNSARNLESKHYYKKEFKNSQNLSNFENTSNNNGKEGQFDEWLKSNENWRKKREQKYVNLKKNIEDTKSGLDKSTYTPRINQLSDIIANTKNFNEFPGIEIHEKLYNLKDYKEHTQKYLQERNKPSFTPVINNYKPKFNMLKTSDKKQKRLNLSQEAVEDRKNPLEKSQIDNKKKISLNISQKNIIDMSKQENKINTNKSSSDNNRFNFNINKSIKPSNPYCNNQLKIDNPRPDISLFGSFNNKLIFYK